MIIINGNHRLFFSTSTNRSSAMSKPTCLTCHLSTTCSWATALPSKVFKCKRESVQDTRCTLPKHNSPIAQRLGLVCLWQYFDSCLLSFYDFLNLKDFSNILIFCEGPSPPHQLILPLHPPGQAVLLKGVFCKMHQGFIHLNLSSGESPLFLAWPTTRVVSVTLPSDLSTSSSITLPRQIKKGKQRKGN